MKQLEQIQVVLQVLQRRDGLVAEGRIAPVDDVLEVFGGYFGGGDVQRQDVVGEVGEGQVLPALPIGGEGDLFGDIQAAVGSEALEDDIFKGELPDIYSCQLGCL